MRAVNHAVARATADGHLKTAAACSESQRHAERDCNQICAGHAPTPQTPAKSTKACICRRNDTCCLFVLWGQRWYSLRAVNAGTFCVRSTLVSGVGSTLCSHRHTELHTCTQTYTHIIIAYRHTIHIKKRKGTELLIFLADFFRARGESLSGGAGG